MRGKKGGERREREKERDGEKDRKGGGFPRRDMTGENGIGLITRELTFNELVVESQYLLKLQSGKITLIPRLLTNKCQISRCQSLDAFSRAQRVTICVWRPGSVRTHWESLRAPQTL